MSNWKVILTDGLQEIGQSILRTVADVLRSWLKSFRNTML